MNKIFMIIFVLMFSIVMGGTVFACTWEPTSCDRWSYDPEKWVADREDYVWNNESNNTDTKYIYDTEKIEWYLPYTSNSDEYND